MKSTFDVADDLFFFIDSINSIYILSDIIKNMLKLSK